MVERISCWISCWISCFRRPCGSSARRLCRSRRSTLPRIFELEKQEAIQLWEAIDQDQPQPAEARPQRFAGRRTRRSCRCVVAPWTSWCQFGSSVRLPKTHPSHSARRLRFHPSRWRLSRGLPHLFGPLHHRCRFLRGRGLQTWCVQFRCRFHLYSPVYTKNAT